MADDVLLGTQFGGRWLIERALSSGGMGSVYVARHADTGRSVALKVIHRDVVHDPELTARFRRETAALASLSHPNVVTFLDSGIDNGNAYLVMELLAGRSLRDVLGAPMPWQRATRIAADVCRALAAVHRAGLVHRDLKPENVFLQDAEGHEEIVKLIDFGIVRLEGPTATASTTTGAVVGTPGYISPEQLRGQAATPASDVYAVGVMLYEMVAGQSPFAAPDVNAMLVRQLIDPIVSPRVHVPGLPVHLETSILRLMDREPDKRIAGAREALLLLTSGTLSSSAHSSLAMGPSVAPGPGNVVAEVSRTESASAAPTRRRVLIGAGIVAAGLLAAFGGRVQSSVPPASSPANPAARSERSPASPSGSAAAATGSMAVPAPAAGDGEPATATDAAVAVVRRPNEARRVGRVEPRADAAQSPPQPPQPGLVKETQATPVSVVPAAPEQAERVLLTMPGSLMRGAAAIEGVFSVTTERIRFASDQGDEAFELDSIRDIVRASGLTTRNRVRLILRGSEHVLLLDDREAFIGKVRKLLTAR